MYKHLFFDDKYLLSKDNVKRSYGTPVLCENYIYLDEEINTSLVSPWVFKLDNGKYRMIYQGHTVKSPFKMKVNYAISDNGFHFKREDLPSPMVDGEIGCIIEDPYAQKEERYKMLVSHYFNNPPYVHGWLYVSSDLITWTKRDGVIWSTDGEPSTSVCYNQKKGCWTIIKRAVAGVRMVGYTETTDWRNFTDFQMCMHQDSLDSDLEELYGMPVFAYDNYFIGLPYIYGGLSSKLGSKYMGGTMKSQLAYSNDGRYWLRSLREPFISGAKGDKTASPIFYAPMVWATSMRIGDDGEIYIYGSATELEHGKAFHGVEYPSGRIFVYKLRRDGFIKLQSADATKESVVATRENIWHSGDLHINLKANKATLAVYIAEEGEDGYVNAESRCRLLEGFSHDDCVPFEGDSRDWVPQFKSGKKIADLIGKTLIFELKFEDGELYSMFGDMTPLFNVPASRYRVFGEMPMIL